MIGYSNIAGALAGLTMMAVGSAADAYVIDFTKASTGHTGSLFGGTVTWQLTASGILNNSQAFDGTSTPSGTGLSFQTDGYGVGRNDDEITTSPKGMEWIEIAFSAPVLINAVYFLDLFVAPDASSYEVGQASVNGGSPLISLAATDIAGTGAPGFVGASFAPVYASVIRFTMLSSNDSFGYADGTVSHRVADIRRISEHLGDPLSITAANLLEFLRSRIDVWTPEYRKRVAASVRLFYRWALDEGLILENPAVKLPPVKVPRSIPRPTPDSVVLDAFARGTLAERAMIALGATLGLRREDIASAHPRDRLGSRLRVIGKGSHERVLPLDELTGSLLVQLEVEQGVDSYYFPGRFGGHLHPATVAKFIRGQLGGGWSTHTLRHRAATVGLESTGDLRAV
ncbi:MAG: tyrosine-type recombinase/integrase, partial [Albidovulum sp.]